MPYSICNLCDEQPYPYQNERAERNGRAEGEKAGRLAGEKAGEKRGRLEGEKIGKIEGAQSKQRSIALKMLSMGMDTATISEATGMSEAEIEALS